MSGAFPPSPLTLRNDCNCSGRLQKTVVQANDCHDRTDGICDRGEELGRLVLRAASQDTSQRDMLNMVSKSLFPNYVGQDRFPLHIHFFM